ncbi:N-acetylmuramoyl-L-alanine amidase [Zongyangia hominis]|uniref:N-acetylmuramoyl-L-alanine amidase n=1 Tax=Zongyangia hominis TaxID=2763677 RepID=A0A926IC51_9FIRM|nr:N-acetylmuramoyl-L-alanine amidase [Zongyangia hominis]MBC8570857.1 N-acetylmuramoyl-L-alanine amidase [Zongyangia hominis]
MKKKYVLTLVVILLVAGLGTGAFFLLRDYLPRSLQFEKDTVELETPAEIRAFTVSAYGENSLIPQENMTRSEAQKNIAAIVEHAATYGYNTIFVDAVAGGEAYYDSDLLPSSVHIDGKQDNRQKYDPLRLLIKEAHRNEIRVYAVIHPFDLGGITDTDSLYQKHPAKLHPEWLTTASGGALAFDPAHIEVQKYIGKLAAEIAEHYNVDGIHLSGVSYAAGMTSETAHQASSGALSLEDFERNAIIACLSSVRAAVSDAGISLGITAPGVNVHLSEEERGGALPAEDNGLDVTAVLEAGLVDYITPELFYDVGGADGDYQRIVQWWGETSQTYHIPVITLNAVSAAQRGDLFALADQIYLNRQQNFKGHILSTYADLASDTQGVDVYTASMYALPASEQPTQVNLSFAQTLAVTRPATDAFTTTYDRFYLMGTSDPSLPLTLNGENVEARGSGGTFGVLKELEVGENIFTFRQGDGVETVITITRQKKGEGEAATISAIKENSVFPTASYGAYAGEEITFSCIAPAGGEVSATFDGMHIPLEQAAVAEDGVPALYKGAATLRDDYPAGVTTRVSTVSYTLIYEGKTSTTSSLGEIYVVGEGGKLTMTAAEYIGTVFSEPDTNSDIIASLKQGSVDLVTDQTDTMCELSSGGWILKSTVDFVEGAASYQNNVSEVLLKEKEDGGQTYTIKGTHKPVFHSSLDDDAFTITLYHTVNVQEGLFENGKLFSDISQRVNDDESVTLRFTLKEGVKLWGYNVEYDLEGNTVLDFLTPPKLSDNPAKPLEGVVIALDAGHGGDDPGSLGPGGSNGATEKDINLAITYETQKQLEALGATVSLTRSDDSRLSFEERCMPPENMKVDFYISFHQNSVAEITDASDIHGTEIYYHYDTSAAFAQILHDTMTTALGRQARGAIQSTYRVTRMTFCPSVLVENGFMPNPAEYETLCDSFTIFRTANAVTLAIIDTIQAAN